MDNLIKANEKLRDKLNVDPELIKKSATYTSLDNITKEIKNRFKMNVPRGVIKFLDILISFDLRSKNVNDICIFSINPNMFAKSISVYRNKKNKVKYSTKLNKDFDLILFDEFVPVKNMEDAEESHITQFENIVNCIDHLNDGGSIIIKMYTMFNQKTLEFVQELYNLFGEVTIIKPIGSAPWSSEKYIICSGYQKRGKPMSIQKLKSFNAKLVNKQCKVINDLIQGNGPRYDFRFENLFS